MDRLSPLLVDTPDLTDEAAVEILDFLYELAYAFEGRYFVQLQRGKLKSRIDVSQPDLFEAFDDELPDF